MIDEAAQFKRYGILIASSLFPEEPKLQDLTCPENDVAGLFGVLDDESIGGFSELLVVKNEPSHKVLRNIQQVLNKAGRDDLVLIYYAGHGKLDRAGRLHLATFDTVNEELETTSIPAQRIRDLIGTADTTKTVLILDCCYSGAIDQSFLRGDVDEQLNVLAGGHGTFIMTASTSVQTAREDVRDGYGVFTKHIIDGIRGEADADGDGVVTMNELYGYVHPRVQADSHQEPMKWDLNVQGELIIAQTGRKPRDERRVAIRERLLSLAAHQEIPDVVLTRALKNLKLPYSEIRTGVAARYDALLDRLLKDDFHVGEFINDWLEVPPDVEPERKPWPEPTQPPRTAPKPSDDLKEETQQPLRPDPQKTTRNLGTGLNVAMSWRDIAACIGWLIFGFPFLFLLKALFNDLGVNLLLSDGNISKNEQISGFFVGIFIWTSLGLFFMRRAKNRINTIVRWLYWLGMSGLFAFTVFLIYEI